MEMERSAFLDDRKQKVLDDLAEFGWHCEEVLPHWDDRAYAYTVGLDKSYGHPELAVFGLKPTVARYALIRAVQAIRIGHRIDLTNRCETLLVGCSCEFHRMETQAMQEFCPLIRSCQPERSLPAYQIVWPTLVAQFPWHGVVNSSSCQRH